LDLHHKEQKPEEADSRFSSRFDCQSIIDADTLCGWELHGQWVMGNWQAGLANMVSGTRGVCVMRCMLMRWQTALMPNPLAENRADTTIDTTANSPPPKTLSN